MIVKFNKHIDSKAAKYNQDILNCVKQSGFSENQSSIDLLMKNHVHGAAYLKDNSIAGYILYALVLDEAELYYVYVDPGFRQQNISDALMAYCFEQCRKRFIKTLFLEVRIDNLPALNLYRKHGFIDIALRKAYYSDKQSDATVMKKIF